MAQNLTLTAYLEQRGKKAKALKRGEAEAFGIPYPLQSGWPRRFGSMEITPAMIEDAAARIRAARQEARGKMRQEAAAARDANSATATIVLPESFPGFVLRQARRYRMRTKERRA